MREVMEARLAARRENAPTNRAPVRIPKVPPAGAYARPGPNAQGSSARGEGKDAGVQTMEGPAPFAPGGEDGADEV